MSAVYLETSALLAWLLGQGGGDDVRAAVDGAETVVTSVLTSLEAERVVTRAVVEGVLREADARRARGALARAGAGWMVMALTDDVVARAGKPFPVEPVRTLDAVHLSTALRFTEVFPDLRMLTLDRRVADNAVALGLTTSSS